MKKRTLSLAIILSSIGHAEPVPVPMPPMVLDQVEFQVAAKQWVSTQSALLTVNINATLTNADLVKTRDEIMQNLKKIANGDWHLTQFDRSQDTSGLEKLFVQAQARVNQTDLTAIYPNAKSVSKPGATYEVSGIEFKPSLEEVQKAKMELRQKLYQQTQEELNHLNAVYTAQHYSINQLLIIDGDSPILDQAKRYRASNEMLTAMAMPAVQAPLAVSNEIIMTALVKAASTRKPAS